MQQRFIDPLSDEQLLAIADDALDHALWLLALMAGFTQEAVLEIMKDAHEQT